MGVIDSQRTTYSDSDRSTAVDESSALLTARQRRRRRSAVEADYEIKSLQYPVKRLKGRLIMLGAIVVLLVLVAFCNPNGEPHGGHPHELLRVALADEHATANLAPEIQAEGLGMIASATSARRRFCRPEPPRARSSLEANHPSTSHPQEPSRRSPLHDDRTRARNWRVHRPWAGAFAPRARSSRDALPSSLAAGALPH